MIWRARGGKLQLVTSPLYNRIIFDRVTRRSVLQLARESLGQDLEVVERKYAMCEIEDAAQEGRLLGTFAAGIAVCPSSNSLK